MIRYSIPMVPGPTRVSSAAFRALIADYGAGFSEPEFFELYRSVSSKLRKMMGTEHEILIQSGEAMSILWGALKSTLIPGEKLLAVSTGVFGAGFADMANCFGGQGHVVEFGYDETIHDYDRIEDAIRRIQPKVITAVHCETPSGTLNPLKMLGELKQKYHVPLYIIDAVASIGSTPINADDVHADIVMGGSQKALSLPPNLGFCSVSPTAWEIIQKVGYCGYEAFGQFKGIGIDVFDHPNTPDWNGIAALNDVLDDLILFEELDHVYARHEAVAAFTRTALVEMGYRLFPKPDAVPAPSVTAAYVPEGISFTDFNESVRARGLGIGGSMGPLTGKVFRIGHMGIQATMANAKAALDVLGSVRH